MSLTSNNIGDSGAAAIAEALKNDSAVVRLDLSGNSIGGSGAAAVAEALKSSTVLTDLILNNNSIGDIGAAAVAEALKSTTALTSLYLDNKQHWIQWCGCACRGAEKQRCACIAVHLSVHQSWRRVV